MVKLFFDTDDEDRVNGVTIHFIEYVEEIAVFHRLGYSPKAWVFTKGSDKTSLLAQCVVLYHTGISASSPFAEYRRIYHGHYPFRRFDLLIRQKVFYTFNNIHCLPLLRHELC